MTDKHINRRPIINEYRPERPPHQPEQSRRITETRLSGNALKEEIIRRFNEDQDFQRISSDLGISYAEVARIAGGLS